MPISALHREIFAEKQGNTWLRAILSSKVVLVQVLATRQQKATRVNTEDPLVSYKKRNSRKSGITSSHEALEEL